jgi:hypothetical protein
LSAKGEQEGYIRKLADELPISAKN